MNSCLSVVIFTSAGQLYGIESSAVRGRGRTQSLPQASLLQDQVQERTKNRVVDFSVLLGQSACLPDQWLRLKGTEQDWFLGLTGEMELVELQVNQIHPLPRLLAARLEFHPLKALTWYQQQLVNLLDIRLLSQLAEKRLIVDLSQQYSI